MARRKREIKKKKTVGSCNLLSPLFQAHDLSYYSFNSVVNFQELLQGILPPPSPWKEGYTGSFQVCSSTLQIRTSNKKICLCKISQPDIFA